MMTVPDGVVLGQLATGVDARRLERSSRRYTEALDTSRVLGEPRMEAVAWHMLGMVQKRPRTG